MAIETFEHRYFINAPVEAVYSHLAEASSYIGLSPLVVAVSGVQHSTDAEGHAVLRYESVERFRFLGFIQYDNHIKVTTTFTEPLRKIVSDVDSPARVKVRFVFEFQRENGGTAVHETVTANAAGFMMGFVVSEARRVQLARAEILKTRLEKTG